VRNSNLCGPVGIERFLGCSRYFEKVKEEWGGVCLLHG